MRSKTLAWILVSLLLPAGVAQAGTLTSATWVGDFQGTPFTLLTSGASLTASGTTTANGIGAVSLIVAAPRLTLLNTADFGIPQLITQTLGGSQTLSGGVANQGVSGALNQYLGVNPFTVLFPVALSVGVAGNFTTTAVIAGLNIPVEVTATYFPWTTGSHTFSGLTTNGIAAPDVTTAGTNRLFGGVGRITLVAPTRLRVCAGEIFGSFPCVPGSPGLQSRQSATATRLTLNFAVPEPGIALLLAAGGIALAARERDA